MPTYQYECEDCSHKFERFQSMTADPVTICPECEGAVKRLISGGAGFLFKGDGFYTTDYRSDHYKQREKADKDQASGAKDSSKSDSSKSDSSKSDASKSDTSKPANASTKSDSAKK